MKKKQMWMYINIVVLIILLLVGTFFDLKITEQVSGQWLFIGRITEIFGGLPMTLLITLSLHIGLTSYLRAETSKAYLVSVLLQIAAMMASISNYYVIFRYLSPTNGHSHGSVSFPLLIVSLILGVITYVIIQKRLTMFDHMRIQWLMNQAKKVLWLIFLVLILTQGIKTMVARPRYWTIVANLHPYVPWYTISGPTMQNELMSFISGHTSNAYVLVALSWFFKDSDKAKSKVVISGLLWGFLVGFGRLFSGQHFLTDVSMAALIVILLFLWIDKEDTV